MCAHSAQTILAIILETVPFTSYLPSIGTQPREYSDANNVCVLSVNTTYI